MTTMYKYSDILETIRTIAPQTHIAGGAVRDTLLEREIHDVDIFAADGAVDEIAKLLRSDFSYVKVGDWVQYLGFSDPAMTRVAKFEKADEAIPVCIIGLRPQYTDPEANIGRFDFGICMAAFDGENIIRADGFRDDAENKVFTLLRADNEYQFAYSMSRYNKITADRYHGWDLRIPSDFKAYAMDHTFRHHWYQDYETGEFCPKGFHGESVLPKVKERA
jgi:Poly A polymerase head domain